MNFIFMLTRNDRTVEDAADHLQDAWDAGVEHIGFKDVGLPFDALRELNASMKAQGATTYLEMVSLDPQREQDAARAAIELGVDCLLGGTHVDQVLPVLAGSPVRYFPFPGRIVGHPSVLEGTLEEIVASAVGLCEREGVAGLDLLAYRWPVDGAALARAVCAAVTKPVIVAGSIDGPTRIAEVASAAAAGFTIGTAALDGKFPGPDRGLRGQLSAILAASEASRSLDAAAC